MMPQQRCRVALIVRHATWRDDEAPSIAIDRAKDARLDVFAAVVLN
jgi:hypothetical protein